MDTSGPLSGAAVQPRRLALLALLAASPSGRISRDKLAAYLWSDVAPEHARSLLADSVYALRKALGKEALLTRGHELCLNTEIIATDVGAFLAALECGDYAEAAALYTGPFLDGFSVRGAPPFEHWAESQREHLAGRYAGALEALAERHETGGHQKEALLYWRRLAEHDPYCSRTALRLMRALVATGERAAALQQARVHEAAVRRELEMDPDPEVLAMAEYLRGAWGQGGDGRDRMPEAHQEEPTLVVAAGDGRPAARENGGTFTASPIVAPSTERVFPSPGKVTGRTWWQRTAMLGLGAGLLLALALQSYRWHTGSGGAGELPAIRSIAVLPLTNLSADSAQEYFADGMTDALITELARYGELRVVSRTSVMQYKESRRPLRMIAADLGVDAVVTGTVVRDGDHVRITTRLIHAPTDKLLWTEAYERTLRGILHLQREVAQAVAHSVHAWSAPDADSDLSLGNVDPTAYALYLRGRYLWNEHQLSSYSEARAFFERAAAIAPTFAPAYAGLADVYIHLHDWSQGPPDEARTHALYYARRALVLDERLAEAHTSLGHALMHAEDWEESEHAYRRALELNPSYVDARLLYSFLLAARARFDEATHHARTALATDPLTARTHYFAGYVFFVARRYAEAITKWQRMVELYPDDPRPYFGIGRALIATGRSEEAVEWAERGLARGPDPNNQLSLAYILAAADLRDEARMLLDRYGGPGQASAADPLSIAAVHARLGDTDAALFWLTEATRVNHGWTMFFNVEPAYDGVRQDPRFRILLRDLRLN
jgi:TolB-like protein/DNA-binding SARP family transcriptional activator/Tfp pilus assembly protein PilF